MTQANLLKNPVLRNKVETNISNPAGDINTEIAEQDLNGQAGGMIVNTATAPSIVTVMNTRTYICNPATFGVICSPKL